MRVHPYIVAIIIHVYTYVYAIRANVELNAYRFFCRCTADHQRDAQYPFLDERVVAYLQQLPMAIKVTGAQ